MTEEEEEKIAAGERATSYWGFLAHPAVPFGGILVAVAGAFCMVVGLLKGEKDLALFGGLDVISAGGACVIAWIVGRQSIASALGRESDWLQDLPFTVENQYTLLGDGRGTVEVTFRDAHPAVEDWARLLQKASGDVLAFDYPAQVGRVFELSSKPVPALPGGHRIWRAWHDLVERTLVPLHARYAIESVRVRRR